MDQYFEWYTMSEERKVKFAKFRLIRQARLYWGNVERLSRQRRDPYIASWKDMKLKLRAKYLPFSYEQRLLDQWQKMTQGNQIVSEYIAIFDEYVMRCGVSESESVTLSRFRAGLNEDIKRELILKEVNDLEHAYQVARDAERFPRKPTYQSDSSRFNAPGNRPNQNRIPANRPRPNPQPIRRDDKGKAPMVQKDRN